MIIILLPSLKAFTQSNNDCSDIYRKAVIETKKKSPNYQMAISLLSTLRTCLSTFKNANKSLKDSSDVLNLRIFKEVNDAKLLAEQKTLEANEQTNNARALYWASESEKINPIQGIRLLEKSFELSKNQSVKKVIEYQFENIFRSANKHGFLEKKRFYNTISAKFSFDGKYLIVEKSNGEIQILDRQTLHTPLFLKNEFIKYQNFSNDCLWLTTKNQDNEVKIWDLTNGKMIGASPKFRGNSPRKAYN